MNNKLIGVKLTLMKMKNAIICSTLMPSSSFFIAKEMTVYKMKEPIITVCMVDSIYLPTDAEAALKELLMSICCGIAIEGNELVSNSGVMLSVSPVSASL